MNYTQKSCPVCCSGDISPVVEIPRAPVFCNVLWRTRHEALNAPVGEISLGFCKDCGHIFNMAFDPGRMQYTGEYENSLHFSPRFQEYVTDLAEGLVRRYHLSDKTVMEIGCGKGDFLSLICGLGANRGIGFDPSCDVERACSSGGDAVTIVRDYYSEKYSDQQADLVCCRHVLEHVQAPIDFLAGLRRAAGQRPATVFFFEVPNAVYTLRDLGIWDIIYEHCSYFSASSLARLFITCGFEVSGLSEGFEGQFLRIEARLAGDGQAGGFTSGEKVNVLASHAAGFAGEYSGKVLHWRRELERFRQAGLKTVIWGGGSKGVSFLNTVDVKVWVEYVVDVSPYKHGRYVPVTGQKILNPELLRTYRPDVIIVMNPVYLHEIRQMVDGLGIAPEIIPV
jgi:SAM-dependent methyltransferase